MPPPDGTVREAQDIAGTGADDGVGAGLDALDTPVGGRERGGRARLVRLAGRVLPLLVAVTALIAIWQALWAAAIWPEFQLPAPKAVWAQIAERIDTGEIFG